MGRPRASSLPLRFSSSLILRNAGGRSPERVFTLPATLTVIGATRLRGSAVGVIPPWKRTKRSPRSVSSAWATEMINAAALTVVAAKIRLLFSLARPMLPLRLAAPTVPSDRPPFTQAVAGFPRRYAHTRCTALGLDFKELRVALQ